MPVCHRDITLVNQFSVCGLSQLAVAHSHSDGVSSQNVCWGCGSKTPLPLIHFYYLSCNFNICVKLLGFFFFCTILFDLLNRIARLSFCLSHVCWYPSFTFQFSLSHGNREVKKLCDSPYD